MRVALWNPLRRVARLVALVAVVTSTVSVSPATATVTNKTLDLVGIVDCGLASGKRCDIGMTLKLRTRDLSGNLDTVEIDISWIKHTLPDVEQDDFLRFEVEEKPGGGFQALRIYTPDKKKRVVKEDDDVRTEVPVAQVVQVVQVELPTISIDDVEVEQPFGESLAGAGPILLKAPVFQLTETATFTVSLSRASSSTVTVNYATRDGTATGDGACPGNPNPAIDFVHTSGQLTFAPGQTEKTIDVTICEGSFSEDDEEFTVELSNPQGAVFGDPVGVGTILTIED